MRVKTPMRVAAVSAVLALGLAACGGGGDGDSDAGAPAGEPGGTYSVNLTEPSYLAPASKCYESECSAVLKLVNDPVVSVDPKSGDLKYDGLAESIESKDQKVWTVKLKKGRTFQNGEPIDADAFLRAWNYSQNPKNAQETAGFMSHIEGSGKGTEMSGLKKIDDTTFQVTLSGPFSQFGQQMSYSPAFSPIAKACLADVKACNEKPIGTGAYQIQGKWRHDEGITVTKWKGYKGEQPATADTVQFKMFTSPTAELREFQNGNLDLIRTVTPDIYLEAKGQLGDKMIEEPSATLTYLGFPIKKAPFDNQKFRQALSLSINRDQIIDKVLNGQAKAATDIPTPPIPGHRNDACEFCKYDPKQAKQLLKESGVDPKSLTLEMYFNSDAGHDAWVEAASRQIQENLGIDYKLKST